MQAIPSLALCLGALGGGGYSAVSAARGGGSGHAGARREASYVVRP
jgi:hypothetical protein